MMQLLLVSKFSRFSFFVSLFLIFLSLPAAAQEGGFTTKADYAVLYDIGADAYLYEKEADAQMTPSSMTKLMTTYILFEHLKSGSLKLDDTFHVSEKAWRKGGSKMFVKVNTEVPIEKLVQGIVVQSGNDACIVIAEGISGSEEAFAEEMNRTAQKLGMTNTHFKNASGWPEEGHYSTARDLAILAVRLIQDFPDYYHYFAEKEYTYNGIRQYNRNPLLGKVEGVDGLKTGHTEAAGYGLVASAKQDDRRLVSVVNGLASEKEREVETDRLLRHGFRDFDHKKLFAAGEKVEDAEVWFGKEKTVPLVVQKDVWLLLNRRGRDDLKAEVVYNSPIPAPVAKGQEIATLIIRKDGMEDMRVPLAAGEDVERLSYFSRIVNKVVILLLGRP